jgi:hypothetical protein
LASYSLFIFYCSIMFGKQDLVHSGTTLAEAAVFIVDLTIGSSMDRTGYLAVPNTQLNSHLYLLFLGLGVGDTFAQASEAGRHTVLHPELSKRGARLQDRVLRWYVRADHFRHGCPGLCHQGHHHALRSGLALHLG